MTTTSYWPPLRQLAVHVPRGEDEPLFSWVLAMSRELDAPPADVLAHLGLGAEHLKGHAYPSAAQEADAEWVSHHASGALQFRPHPLVGPRPGPNRPFCPVCLAETGGRWQSHWRHPWIHACTRHGRRLGYECPHCGRPAIHKVGVPVERSLRGYECMQRAATALGRNAARCGGDLRTVHTAPVTSEEVATTEFLRDALSNIGAQTAPHRVPEIRLGDHSVPVTWLMRDVHRLARLQIYRLGEKDHATAVHRATVISQQPTLRRAADSLAELLHTPGTPPISDVTLHSDLLKNRDGGSPWLHAVVAKARPAGRIASQIQLRTHGRAPALTLDHQLRTPAGPMWPTTSSSGLGTVTVIDASLVAQAAWPSLIEHLRLPRVPMLPWFASAAIATTLITGGRKLHWRDACADLHLQVVPNVVSRFWEMLKEAGEHVRVLEELEAFGEHLTRHPPPIDYRRRRLLLDDQPRITTRREGRIVEDWYLLRTPRWRDYVNTRAWQLHTGSDPLLLPPDHPRALVGNPRRAAYTRWVRDIPEKPAAALEADCELILQRMRINEPLWWQPVHDGTGWTVEGRTAPRRLTTWDRPSIRGDLRESANTVAGKGARRHVHPLTAALSGDVIARQRLLRFALLLDNDGLLAAARAGGFGMPAFHQQIRHLETATGTRLLDRSGHRARLTHEGRRLAESARRLPPGPDVISRLPHNRKPAPGAVDQQDRPGAHR